MFFLLALIIAVWELGLITSRCLGKEPVLRPRRRGRSNIDQAKSDRNWAYMYVGVWCRELFNNTSLEDI